MVLIYEKSFASHLHAEEWNYNLNKKIPRQIPINSENKFWFNCRKCNHSFRSSLYNISQGKWCSYCGNKKLCNNKKCRRCFRRSFASNLHSNKWNYELNSLTPREVFKNSNKRYWFDCKVCNHIFEASISNISGKSYSHYCPYCTNQKLCENLECKKCYEKSFASDERSKSWNFVLNDTTPRKVFKNTHKSFWFNCEKYGHFFENTLNHISDGRWCPYCQKI